MRIATNIETSTWRKVVATLYNEGWKVEEKYMAYDASIDFDFIILKSSKGKIYLAWDILSEGEIKCDDNLFLFLGKKFELKFDFGIPKNLNFKTMLITRMTTFSFKFITDPHKTFKDFF